MGKRGSWHLSAGLEIKKIKGATKVNNGVLVLAQF
jgi:hypothetical protein